MDKSFKSRGAKRFERNGRVGTWYQCSDCGMVMATVSNNTMRPNLKFCNALCMAYVLENRLQRTPKRPRGWEEWVRKYDAGEL